MVKRPVLRECDAWDIALAWREQLRGCVRLKTATQKVSSSIVPSFEWVSFVLYGSLHLGEDPRTAGANSRAATIAWFALSCCEGFSGVENPGFWKRVFYELLYPKLPCFNEQTYSYCEQLPITDAVRFFDHPDRPFPRIKLPHGNDDDEATTTSVFLGRVPHEDEELDAKLHRILAKLQPFIRKADAMRSVPVEFDVYKLPPPEHGGLLHNVLRRGESESRAAVSVASMVAFPQLYLRSLNYLEADTDDTEDLLSLTPPSNIEVLAGGSLQSFVHHHRVWHCLLDQLQDESSVETHSQWIVTHIDVMQKYDFSYSHLGVMYSALPHLQSVQSVKLPAYRHVYGPPMSIASDWAWLGYAIFHPDATSTSGFKSVEVDLSDISPGDSADLARMAVGNNLIGEETTGYLECLIRSGTKMETSPEKRLITVAAESWVSVCPHAAAEDLDHHEWVCVINPGFGPGWIRRDNVIETRTRRAGESCLRALSVKNFTEDPMEDATLETLLVNNYQRFGGARPRREWETEPVRPLEELKPSCLAQLKALHVMSVRDGA